MPPTFRHGKSAVLRLIAGGSTYQLSTAFDDSGLQRAVDTANVTAYGDSDKKYLAGLKGATFPIAGHFDKTVEGYLAGVLAASTNPTWVYGPEGSASGRRKYSFGGVLTALDVSSPVADKVSISASVTVSGAVTSTTF